MSNSSYIGSFADKIGRPFVAHTTEDVTVILNKLGEVVTTYPGEYIEGKI